MMRPELGTLTVGQEVIVREPQHRGRGSVRHARVAKVARVWVTLAAEWQDTDYWGKPRTRTQEWRMRLDTQDEGIRTTHYGSRFLTLEQHAYETRESEAHKFLLGQGLLPGYGTPWHGREVELADLIRKHISGTPA